MLLGLPGSVKSFGFTKGKTSITYNLGNIVCCVKFCISFCYRENTRVFLENREILASCFSNHHVF